MKTTQIMRLSALIVVLAALTLPAHGIEVTKTLSRNSSSVKGTEIDNRYGSITVKHWNKQEIAIEAVVKAKAATQQRADELLKAVSVDFAENGTDLKATTRRENTQTKDGESLTTDIEVTLPASYRLDLEQKYGSVTFPSSVQQGKTSVEVAYGSVNGGNFNGEFSMEISYSSFSIDKIAQGELECSYCGKASVGEIGSANVELRYSKLSTVTAKQMNVELGYSEVTFRDVTTLTATGKYSKIEIESLRKSLSVDGFRYSKLTLNGAASGVDRIVVTGADYGSVAMNLSGLSKLNLDLGMERYSKYSVDEGLKAKAGNGGGTLVKISGNYGNVKLR